MRKMNLFLGVFILLVGFAVPSFGAQIYLNINLPDLRMSAGSSEGEKGGSVWSQVYADLQLTFGTIQQTGVSYNPEYVYDPVSGKNKPSPDKGWININFYGPETSPTKAEDYRSQYLSLNHGGISLTESVSSYTYIQDLGEGKGIVDQGLTGPIWSVGSGNFYGNFHIRGSGNSSFYEYAIDGDAGKEFWFTGYTSVPVQWDVAAGVNVPAMSLAGSPVPEPSTLVLAVIGIVGIAIAAYRRRKHS